MGKRLVLVIVAVAALGGCGSSAKKAASTTLSSTTTEASVTTETIGEPHPQGTYAPSTTAKPLPPATLPAPIQINGQGDQVVAVPTPASSPEIVHFVYNGSGNFIVNGLDASLQQTDLLVNVIGSYDGYVPLNFEVGSSTTKLQVQSTGSFQITLLDPRRARHFSTSIAGHGPDVVIFTGTSGIAALTHDGQDNFIVNFDGSDGGSNLLVNEIGTYNGQVPITGGPGFVIIDADGNWTIRVS